MLHSSRRGLLRSTSKKQWRPASLTRAGVGAGHAISVAVPVCALATWCTRRRGVRSGVRARSFADHTTLGMMAGQFDQPGKETGHDDRQRGTRHRRRALAPDTGSGSGGSRWESAAPIRYPDPDIVVLDPRFQRLVLGNAAIERIATGFRFTEGPVWFGDGRYLLFSDIPNDRILRWDETDGGISVFREPSHYANGNTRDRQGRLVTCEHDTQHLTRTEYDGTITVLADSFEGKRLTGPNDVVVKSDGSIWFSDNGAGTRGNYLGHTCRRNCRSGCIGWIRRPAR